MQDKQDIKDIEQDNRSTWRKPTIIRMSLKRTLAGTGSLFDGENQDAESSSF